MKSRSLLGLAIGSIVSLVGITAPLLAIPQISVAQPIQIARAPRPLATELRDKPVVVDIYATWCPGCQNIAPTLSMLREQYKGKAHFIVLDVTNRSTTRESEAKARKFGLSEFFSANKSQTSTVAIINPRTGQILKRFHNNPDQNDYSTVLDRAIASMKQR
ncbi:TlpA family protein disulfide reductase [Merismopedia glauca]|uniref:Thiol-disulfide isomerase n=1 Tax=Merismopedia glauca CCAP 1448/3 TaxID=1296344 RepID=A0A2T1C131_9CYAN|nr:thioredoxin family protein [Merismopedia glauca]PSB01971.1 thiol-disulfide isomerase [Merismopedia glauca CCAP 1448/3]